MVEKHTLYGIPHSLYTGRARSYLIKNRIPFNELSCGHESFKADIVPKAKLATIPVLKTTSGEVIRDGAAIIEHFELANGRPCLPTGARQQTLSHLFDLIGCEGLLRPAMHYRWNFPEENLEFLNYHFFNAQRAGPNRQEKTDYMMDRMRFAGRIFGVSDTNHNFIEELYMDFLQALNQHFSAVPYLLGWKPCIGDFGLMAPMFAHLGRDPKPLALMQREAIHVYRWVERMNRAESDTAEFFEAGHGYLEQDEIPETLVRVLSILAEDLVPETQAAALSINHWLADNQPSQGTSASRFLGKNQSMAEFTVRGEIIAAGAQPYRFFMLQKVQDEYLKFSESDKLSVSELLEQCGLKELLNIKLKQRLAQVDNLEVWL